MLSNIRIVLVNTSHPGNIGAVARAMKNMGLDQLYLVGPKHFPHPDATARASGADDVLERAIICNTLDEAIADCQLTFATTARQRSLAWPQVTPRGCAERAAQFAPQHPVAIVFGREDSGLTNDELERCHYMLHIPSNPDYCSLNLGAAAQVVAYELRLASLDDKRTLVYEPEDRPATQDQIEGLMTHFQHVMEQVNFLEPGNPRNVIRRLRRLFAKAQLDENEMNILRGMLTAVEKKVGK